MKSENYSQLQIREIFHLEFLRYFGRRIKAELYALKGGVNLRLYFNSIRYSEDMDLDVSGISIHVLKEHVLSILKMPAFQANLKPFGINKLIPPAMEHAKQTATTQRFKIHLITLDDVDLFTKIEFSRRNTFGKTIIETPNEAILRAYKIGPIVVPHYDINSAIIQKIMALAGRATIQARDIFDLYTLHSIYNPSKIKGSAPIANTLFLKAHTNIFEVKFKVFQDTVIAYLNPEDQQTYNKPSIWEEIQLKTYNLIEQVKNEYA